MIAIIISWIVLFIVFSSFGEMTNRFWNKISKTTNNFSPIDKLWIGLCTIGVATLYLSIFTPLNSWVLIGIIAVALAYHLLNRNILTSYFSLIKQLYSNYSAPQKALFCLVVLVVLLYSLSTPLIYDEGLYHLQAMQWADKYKTIIGIGNIHGRLGFNSSFLLLSTLFNYHPSVLPVLFTLNSFCLLAFSLWLVNCIAQSKNILQSLVLAPILVAALFSLGTNASSTSTDILPNILIIYILLSWILNKKVLTDRYFPLAYIAMFCITLKLSSAIILFVVLLCIVSLIKEKNVRSASLIILVGVVVASPWLVRFIIQTGYLVYPFSAIDVFSFDWKIPINLVALEKDSAYAWARMPYGETSEVLGMSFTEWLPIWIKNLSLYNLGFYLLALVSPLVMLFTKRSKETIAWLIAATGVVFGVCTAPDFRFGFGFIICAGLIPLLLLSDKIKQDLLIYAKEIVLLFTIAIIVGLVYVAIRQVETYQHLSNRHIARLVLQPQSATLLKDKEKQLFKEYKLNNTTIFVPQETNQCFDTSIPCMPYYNTNIEMRGNTLKDGFRIKTTHN